MTEKEFWAYHEKNPGQFPDVSYTVNKNYISAASKRKRYFQYVSRMQDKEEQIQLKMAEKEDDQAVSFREQALKMYRYRCQLMQTLSTDEIHMLRDNAGGFMSVIDVAHIQSRGSTPEKKWDLDNVVLLNRYSHSMLDQGKHPLKGTPISPAEKAEWWKRIVNHAMAHRITTEVVVDGDKTEEA